LVSERRQKQQCCWVKGLLAARQQRRNWHFLPAGWRRLDGLQGSGRQFPDGPSHAEKQRKQFLEVLVDFGE